MSMLQIVMLGGYGRVFLRFCLDLVDTPPPGRLSQLRPDSINGNYSSRICEDSTNEKRRQRYRDWKWQKLGAEAGRKLLG